MYLSIKNLRYKKKQKKSKNFDLVKIELFFIKTIKESINYELNLSNTSIQNIFHYEKQKDDEYEIEKILNKQNQKYFVK